MSAEFVRVIGRRGEAIKAQRASAAVFGGSTLLTVYLGFEAGGFFPGSTALAAIGVAVALILRIGAARDPFGGLTWRSAVAIAAIALLAVWTLLSSAWSHAPGRAVLEFDRVLLYLLVLVLFATLRRRQGSRTALAGGFGLGSLVLCTAALATRTLPAVFPIRPEIANDRLAYPLTYWNALGLLAALGIIIFLGLSASERLPRALRALAAAAVPILAATLLLTFSRGAIAAGLVGLLVLCATCRSRALLFALVATGPATALVASVGYSATALAAVDPTGAAAISEGHHVALVVGLASVASAILRAALARWDTPRERDPVLGGRVRRALTVLAAVVVAAAAGGGAVAFDLPHKLSHQYDRFVVNQQLKPGQPIRERLLNPANTGRLSAWRVAVDSWKSESLHGTGAGTYQNQWNRLRDEGQDLVNAHSLYLEVLSDLGLVGLALLVLGLVMLVTGVATRVKGSDRAVGASLLAAASSWLLHAGVDWDWQMPVITWWLFAAGGLGLARGRQGRGPALAVPGRFARVLGMLGVGLVVLLAAQVGLSQRNLTRSIAAFDRGDCNGAVRHALDATSYIGARAEPYEVIGYCDARYGHTRLAIAAVANAINRDPENWEYRYDMALVRGLGGLDPRADANRARALNPLSPLTVSLATAMRTSNPRLWRARAASAQPLVP
jgi:O-antigen ligase